MQELHTHGMFPHPIAKNEAYRKMKTVATVPVTASRCDVMPARIAIAIACPNAPMRSNCRRPSRSIRKIERQLARKYSVAPAAATTRLINGDIPRLVS